MFICHIITKLLVMGKFKKKFNYLFFGSGSKVEMLPDGSGSFVTLS